VSILLECGRLPEAAMFARAYAPSKMSGCVADWKADLATVNAKAAEALADPGNHPEMFEGLEVGSSRARAGGESGAARRGAARRRALLGAAAFTGAVEGCFRSSLSPRRAPGGECRGGARLLLV
jgi:coatomer subunit beta'